jgi:hypothetical protein
MFYTIYLHYPFIYRTQLSALSLYIQGPAICIISLSQAMYLSLHIFFYYIYLNIYLYIFSHRLLTFDPSVYHIHLSKELIYRLQLYPNLYPSSLSNYPVIYVYISHLQYLFLSAYLSVSISVHIFLTLAPTRRNIFSILF